MLFKIGFFFNENLSSLTSIFLLFLLFIYYIHYNCKINAISVKIIILIILLQHITYYTRGFPSDSSYILWIVNLLSVLIFVSNFSCSNFFRYFSNIIYIICIASLICVILEKVNLTLYRFFPILTNSTGHSVYFLGLTEVWTTYSIDSGANRQQGIFWEPGAFQTMIIFASIIDLYDKKMHDHIFKRLIVYVLTIFFTYSTTGYLCMIMVIFLYLINKFNYSLLSVFLFSVILLLVVDLILTKIDGFLYFTIFGKIEMALYAFTDGESNIASSRVESIIYPFKAFLDSPIVGLGNEGNDELVNRLGHSMFTCTFVNYFAKFGLFCGILHMIGFLKLLNGSNKTIIEISFLILLMLLTTISENFAFNPLLEVFMIYGYHSNSIKI